MVDDLVFSFHTQGTASENGTSHRILANYTSAEIDLNSELKTKSQILTKIPIFVNVSTPIGL